MKFNIKKLVIVLVLIMLVSFTAAGITLYFTGGVSAVSVGAAQIKTSKSFPAQEIENIIIKTVSTRVNVIPVVDREVGIDFYGNITTNLTDVKPELSANIENGTLNIEISYPKTINIGLINFEKLYLDVYVPDNYPGSIEVETVSGDLDIRRLKLSGLDFKSLSGNINTESVIADMLDIETASGTAVLKDTRANIKIDSISGQVNAIFATLEGDINIKTISGKAEIELPGNSAFDFEFGSVSGNIKNEFPADIKLINNRKIEGSVGNGANRIIISTTSGDISIKKGE
jgi:DUF4097 and DUF4098 domain-containing protein YvlB